MAEKINGAGAAAEEVTKEEEFKIEILDHEDFTPISDVKYLSSTDFCKSASALFKSVFADFEGCELKPVQGTNNIMLALYFNHKDYSGSDMPVALSKDANTSNSTNETLRSFRNFQSRINNGDRYYLTPEAKSSLGDLLMNINVVRNKNNNGINWAKVSTETAEQANTWSFSPMMIQYTVVNYIDPAKVAGLIYGKEEDENNKPKWEYMFNIMHSLPTIDIQQSNNPANWMLQITRVSVEETFKLAAMYGLSVRNGLHIVR